MIAGPAANMLNRTVGRANFDFTPAATNQLALRKGGMITIVQKGEPGGWSKGMDEHGKLKNIYVLMQVFECESNIKILYLTLSFHISYMFTDMYDSSLFYDET